MFLQASTLIEGVEGGEVTDNRNGQPLPTSSSTLGGAGARALDFSRFVKEGAKILAKRAASQCLEWKELISAVAGVGREDLLRELQAEWQLRSQAAQSLESCRAILNDKDREAMLDGLNGLQDLVRA